MAWALSLLGPSLFAGAALAGPASYDKDSKSFTFRYTFTTLASGGDDVGNVTKPSSEQEDTVRALVGAVSQVLSQATEGRASIGRLDYVDDIKDADIVISLTGQPASAGVSHLGAIDGKPGHILLYYQSLAPEIRQDVIFTVVHEMGHYIFGLMDEYRPDLFPGGCPSGRPGPGCLMDNYLSGARGWMGRLCRTGEHNVEPAQSLSCQDVVDKFFSNRGVNDKNPTIANDSDAGRQTVVAAAIGKVRDEAAKRAGRRGGAGTFVASLASFARKTLTTLIADFNRDNPNKVIFTPEHIRTAVELIAKVSGVIPISKPLGLEGVVFDLIKAEAKRLGEQHADKKSPTSRQSAIRSGLAAFVRILLEQQQFAPDAFDKDAQRKLIDQFARDEARDPQEKAFDQLVGMTTVQVDLNRGMARDIVTILDQLDAPGTRKRLDSLAAIDKRLKKYSVPGRTSDGFGLRRSRFITPDPISSDYEYVLTQGGVFTYRELRDRGFANFSRLINRERIELVRPRFGAGGLGDRPLDVRIDRPLEAKSSVDFEILRQQSNDDLGAFLNDVFDQLQRNRLENIALLVPPGGLPDDLSQLLGVLKTKLKDNYDVRLDIVQVGSSPIDDVLRDLCVKSHGSVIALTDVDELGAIAQRLKNEESSGSWVIIPQQGVLPRAEPLVAEDQAGDAAEKVAKQILSEYDAFKKSSEEAAKLLSKAVKNRGFLSVPIQTQVDYALANTQSFANLIDQLQVLVASTKAYVATDEQHLKNLKTVKLIGEARQQLKRVEASLRRAAHEKDKLTATPAPAPDPAPPAGDPAAADKPSPRKAYEAQVALADFAIHALSPQIDPPGNLTLAELNAYLKRYEKWLECALTATKDANTPIYHRLDRQRVEDLIKAAQASSGSKTLPVGKETDITLARFYAEKGGAIGDSHFELIVGLSRPLPKVWNKGMLAYESRRPSLTLYSESGQAVTTSSSDARVPTFDKSTSTDTLLVYRIQDPTRIPEGWYTPVLGLDPDVLHQLSDPSGDNEINFTFSVGSLRPNVRLTASLVQPADGTTRGVVYAKDKAVIEVLVSAGNPVRSAEVFGYYQRIAPGTDEIKTYAFPLKDDGATGGDKLKDDGVYTGEILLGDVRVDTEFRVFLQAETTDGKAKFIALDDPNRDDGKDETKTKGPDNAVVAKDTKAAEGEVFKFQRATSVHFLVKH